LKKNSSPVTRKLDMLERDELVVVVGIPMGPLRAKEKKEDRSSR